MQVPQLDEAEAFREALRREARTVERTNPTVAAHLERIEHTVAALMGRDPPRPKSAWKTN